MVDGWWVVVGRVVDCAGWVVAPPVPVVPGLEVVVPPPDDPGEEEGPDEQAASNDPPSRATPNRGAALRTLITEGEPKTARREGSPLPLASCPVRSIVTMPPSSTAPSVCSTTSTMP